MPIYVDEVKCPALPGQEKVSPLYSVGQVKDSCTVPNTPVFPSNNEDAEGEVELFHNLLGTRITAPWIPG